PAFEVLRRADAGFAVVEDETVAEHARGEGGNRHERTAAGAEPADEFRARHFRGVELELASHAVENVARLVVGKEFQIDAGRLNLSGIEAQAAVVEAAGEGHRQLAAGGGQVHRSSLTAFVAVPSLRLFA